MKTSASAPGWPQAVLFDLDGTLADSFDAIARALNRGLREEGFPARSLAWVHRHVGRGALELVCDAVGREVGVERARAVGALFATYYPEIFLEQTPPLPGAREVLAHVHSRTRGRVAVVSNKYAALCRRWLNYWRLGELVAYVSGPESSGARKPDPRAVGPALAALDVRPDQALLVGDMLVDVTTGRNAGIPVVALRSEATFSAALRAGGALAVLFDLDDLPGWLAGNGRGWR